MERRENYHDEIVLLRGFRAGEEQSLNMLFHQLYPALCYYACTITGEMRISEEIAEDAFVKIWQRRTTFQYLKQLKSYLYTTVHNDSVNWLKKNRRRVRNEMAFSGLGAFSEESREDLLIISETFQQLFTALDTLPPQCKKVITMLFLEGKKVRQIAEELNVSTGTVKTHKARGILLLRKQIPTLLLISALFL